MEKNSRIVWFNLFFAIYTIFSIAAIEFFTDGFWIIRLALSVLLAIGGISSFLLNLLSIKHTKNQDK